MSSVTFAWNGVFLVVALGLIFREKEYRAKLCLGSVPVWKQMGAGILVALVSVVGLCGTNILLFGSISLFSWLLMPLPSACQFVAFQLLVATAEELFFRLWMYQALKRRISSDGTVIVLTAFGFALLHLLFDASVTRFVVPFVIGLWFAYAQQRVSNCTVYSLVLAHLLYNLTVL